MANRDICKHLSLFDVYWAINVLEKSLNEGTPVVEANKHAIATIKMKLSKELQRGQSGAIF